MQSEKTIGSLLSQKEKENIQSFDRSAEKKHVLFSLSPIAPHVNNYFIKTISHEIKPHKLFNLKTNQFKTKSPEYILLNKHHHNTIQSVPNITIFVHNYLPKFNSKIKKM